SPLRTRPRHLLPCLTSRPFPGPLPAPHGCERPLLPASWPRCSGQRRLLVTGGLSISCRREKELAKVTIKKEDLELIMTEMEISRAAAERSLREHMGNVVEALITLTN
ncbi:huntingtin-interacting protein K, partial [Cyanistes caeruleus]|uniref:huntingtin-interacting protein K n=1 Tax=Cyanistes caeruleus TaxID=156563 RepID=UPI000CDB111C